MKNILFLVLLLPIGILAQISENAESRNEDFITTDIVSPFYFNYGGGHGTPRWRVGYIKNLNEKSKLGIGFGYGNETISFLNTGNKYSLWEIRPEFYYIINPNKKTIKYFSLEMFYINQKEEILNEPFYSDQNEYLTFDKADYQRQKLGILPKFGMFINLGNRIGLNFYTGVGLRYRINKYSNFIGLKESPSHEEHFPPYYRSEGNKLGVEFSIGLKLFYRIKN
ncbi:MAG: hypothetical protein ACTIJ9_03610 [Aequorivita sp.]